MPNRGKPETSFIAPERLYTLQGFVDASGIARARIYHARRVGVNLPTVDVGRRKFVRGGDAIAFIEALAGLDRKAKEKAAQEMLESFD